MIESKGPIKVTVSDPETGAVLEEKTLSNDYVLITAGKRYLKHTQIMGKTHMLAVSVERPSPLSQEPQNSAADKANVDERDV